jgi:CIC family chloride channel protein
MLGAAVGILAQGHIPGHDSPTAAFVVVGMAAVFAAAARTPISTLIMVVEMTGGYGLIVPAMLANVVAYVVQRALTHEARHPTLYQAQVESREDSPLHRGVLVQRAIDLIETGPVELSEFRLPRLINLLRFGEPIRLGDGDGMLVGVRVEPGSDLDGRTIAETLGRVEDITAVAVLRGSEMLVPRGATALAGGDDLVALARESSHATLRRLAAPPASG